jgi:UDP-N-acetylglucosamine 1-carboxyvinyltransferase
LFDGNLRVCARAVPRYENQYVHMIATTASLSPADSIIGQASQTSMSFQPSRTPSSVRLVIEGGHALHGTLPVGGSKNTGLMLMAATLLAPGRTTIENMSVLHDVWTLAAALRSLGCHIEYDPDHDPTTPETLVVDATQLTRTDPPAELVSALRASFYLFGALIGRSGEARVAMPGGDAWGKRPVNLHLEGLKAFGAEIDTEGATAIARVPGGRLHGGSFHLEPSSVGATVNLMLAAATARGGSRITNAAQEPDVVVLGEMLQAMGARIEGLGTATIEMEGVPDLSPVTFHNAPDRIEAGTYMIAAALSGQPGAPLRVAGAVPDHLGDSFLNDFVQTGAVIETGPDWIEVTAPEHLNPVSITTAPFPGFPTDLQAQWIVFMTCARGQARVTDPIYPERFQHVPELNKMGAVINRADNTALISGSRLHGASVEAADVRAGVALVLAGLVAKGTTTVTGLHHLDRGYERLEQKLSAAGAVLHREDVA